MKLNGIRFIAFLAVMLALLPGSYGLQFSVSGGGAEGSGSVFTSIDVAQDATVNSETTINGADLSPTTSIKGKTKTFEQTHTVTDKSGKTASVYVKVVNAAKDISYKSVVLPKGVSKKKTERWVSAEQWLTVSKADSITCKESASYGTLSADVGIDMVKGLSSGDFVTLSNYYGKAYASDAQLSTVQTATRGSGKSITISGNAKDSSGTYSVNTPLSGSFNGLSASSSAGASTQVSQAEQIVGSFSSTASAPGGKTKTRTSNFGTKYDLNMLNVKGSSPTGTVGYYVDPSLATTTLGAIQGAVNAAESGDTINAAAGMYKEDVNINKGLTLKGSGNPTANSFSLNAILGTSSGGITAPVVNVNPVAKIQDGVTLASSGGTVNAAAGTYKENVMIDKSVIVNGARAVAL